MTRFSEDQLAEMEDYSKSHVWPEFIQAEALELVRGYRDFRAMLQELWRRYSEVRDVVTMCPFCTELIPNHWSKCPIARTEALLAGEGEG